MKPHGYPTLFLQIPHKYVIRYFHRPLFFHFSNIIMPQGSYMGGSRFQAQYIYFLEYLQYFDHFCLLGKVVLELDQTLVSQWPCALRTLGGLALTKQIGIILIYNQFNFIFYNCLMNFYPSCKLIALITWAETDSRER